MNHINSFSTEVLPNDLRDRLRLDLSNNKESVKDEIRLLSAEAVFKLFDYDDTGLMNFESFRNVLPYLGIIVNDAKAYRFFRLCDEDMSGHIDVDEFKVILFLCDPSNGNQVGYSPKKYISPLDAFELFDEDQSNDMDEDEFAYALEYLGVKLSDASIEKLFRDCDVSHTGYIDYEVFREAFIRICDARAELEERGIDVSLFEKKHKIQNILRSVIIEEDTREMIAVHEAKKHKIWISTVRDKRIILERARFRSLHELRKALDLSGQVYVFGEGIHGQFSSAAANTLHSNTYEFQHFDKIVELWNNRVRPLEVLDRLLEYRQAESLEKSREYDRRRRRNDKIDEDLYNDDFTLDPCFEAKHSLFKHLQVATNTVGLYGKRIFHIAASESVLFALADSGEIYAWGGNDYSWHEIQPDSVNQTKWRGDTTPRSQILLGTEHKVLPLESSEQTNVILTADDKVAEVIKVVTKYYNVYEPPPNHHNRMDFLQKTLVSKVSYDDVKFSLECRGKRFVSGTKFEIMEKLYDDIVLEKKLLGEESPHSRSGARAASDQSQKEKAR